MEINKIYLGDCVKIMQSFPGKSIDLIFADPLFNIGINYITLKEIVFIQKVNSEWKI